MRKILLFVVFFLLARSRPGLAFICSMLPCIFCIYNIIDFPRVMDYGVVEYNIFALVISIVLILFTLAIIVVSHRNEEKEMWPVVWSRLIFRFLNYSCQLVILTAIFRPLGPIIWVVLISIQGRYKSATRYSNTLRIISTIGTSIRQNLPLATALEMAADKKGDKHSRALRAISRWLCQGYSLSESISRGYPKCPTEILAMITVSERIGQLPQTIRSLNFLLTMPRSQT